MRFTKKTLEYLFALERGKRFWVLFLYALPIGAAAAALSPSWHYVSWLKNYTLENTDFLYNWNFGFGTYGKFVAVGALLVMGIVFFPILASIVSRSLRVGKFRAASPFADFNDSFFPVFYAAFTYFGIYLIYKLLTTLLLALWQLTAIKWLSMLLSVASLVAVFILVCFLLATTAAYVPIMSFAGIKPGRALHTSMQLTSKYIRPLFVAIALPLTLKTVLGCLISLIGIRWLSFAADIALNAFVAAYMVVFIMTAYYEMEEKKREDYPREYFFYKNKTFK